MCQPKCAQDSNKNLYELSLIDTYTMSHMKAACNGDYTINSFIVLDTIILLRCFKVSM